MIDIFKLLISVRGGQCNYSPLALKNLATPLSTHATYFGSNL